MGVLEAPQLIATYDPAVLGHTLYSAALVASAEFPSSGSSTSSLSDGDSRPKKRKRGD
jgi:hypothetical protein